MTPFLRQALVAGTVGAAACLVARAAGAEPDEPFERFWIGASVSLDIAFLGQGSDVCKLGPHARPATDFGAYCTNPDGSDFPSRVTPVQNDALVPGKSGSVDGGVALGDVRILLSADYAITRNVLAGLRIGYVLNSYPGDAAISGRPEFLRNLHLEARGTYVFGKDPLTRVAFAPMAFAGIGLATTDARNTTRVTLTGIRGDTPVDAWQIGGPALAVIGGGARYGFSSRAALTAAWKLNLAFGYANALFTMGPEVAFQYGF